MLPFGVFSDESLKFRSEMDNLLSEMRASIFKSVQDSSTANCDESLKAPQESSSKVDNIQPLKDEPRSVVPSSNGPFKITVPVSGFKLEELSVKLVGNSIVIEAKHEEKDHKSGTCRKFQQIHQSFFLPTVYDGNSVTSSLSSDGVLTVTAPRKVQQPSPLQKSVEIPISRPSNDCSSKL